jgi:hypothetical protein
MSRARTALLGALALIATGTGGAVTDTGSRATTVTG